MTAILVGYVIIGVIITILSVLSVFDQYNQHDFVDKAAMITYGVLGWPYVIAKAIKLYLKNC